MPTIELDVETMDRLDSIRVGDESDAELSNELSNIYQAQEMMLSDGGDHID